MNALVVLLTQLVAAHPHVDVAVERVAAGVWVARVDHDARVIGADLRELPHSPKLRACLGPLDLASIPEMLPLAGGRGVAVRVRERVCVVKASTVEPASPTWADSVLARPTSREAQVMRQRLLKTTDARVVPAVGAWVVPTSPLTLTVTRDGVTVLRDGGVDGKLSAALRAQLEVGDDLSGLTFVEGDGGVLLTRHLDTYEGSCPAGEEFFDQALIRWNGERLTAPRLPKRPVPEERTTPAHATSSLTFDARDAGDVWAVPVGPYVLEQGTGVLRLTRNGRVAHVETKRLHELVRAACVDVPVFDVRGTFLSAVEDAGGRCVSEARGCTLTLELVDGALSVVTGTPEGMTCVREAVARDGGAETCTLLDPMLGLADYTFARELGRAGQTARMKARLEVALEKGLPEAERAEAKRLLR